MRKSLAVVAAFSALALVGAGYWSTPVQAAGDFELRVVEQPAVTTTQVTAPSGQQVKPLVPPMGAPSRDPTLFDEHGVFQRPRVR